MFCFVPFMHSHVDTTATNRVCCAGQWYKKYDLQEWDSKDYQDIRTSLMSDDTEWRRECIECKNKETWKGLYDSYDQSISNANLEPAVVLKMNSRKPLIVLDFESFLGIIKQNNKGE